MIVTGASRGIGAAIAGKLAGDGCGVIVNYAAEGAESVVSAIRARGGRAEAVRADVAAPDDVAALFDRAQQQMGPVTALVNNAGTLGEQRRVDEREADDLARLIRVNVVGMRRHLDRVTDCAQVSLAPAGSQRVRLVQVARTRDLTARGRTT